MDKKYIIDSIEDGIAKLEADDLSHVFVSLDELPSDSKEGSVLLKKEDGSFVLDNKDENKRRKRILELQRKLQCKKRQ